MIYLFSQNNRVHFVTNTIPARHLRQELSEFEARFFIIVCASKSLSDSYRTLAENSDKCKLLNAPSNTMGKLLFYFLLVGIIKVSKAKIFIYHECCNPFLDLCILFFSPTGKFIPQVTMSDWSEISYKKYPGKRLIKLLQLLKVVKKFKFWECPKLDEEQADFATSVREYPKSIKYVKQKFEVLTNIKPKAKKILLLAGISYGHSEEIRNIFLNLIKIANKFGFSCYVKDHPNAQFRLEVQSEIQINLDSSTPIELVDDDFWMVIGLSSTALARYPNRAFSIIQFVNSISELNKNIIRKHFKEIGVLSNIKEFRDYDEFREILIKYQNEAKTRQKL